MKTAKKILYIFTVVILFSTSCATPVEKILNHTAKYENREVKVKGRVESTTNIRIMKYYILDDGTGEIYVVTDDPLPPEGSKQTAKGIVKQYLKIGKTQVVAIKTNVEE